MAWPRPWRKTPAKRQLALADAAARYGRLWRQGLPYSSLMLNSINHPDARGIRLFADLTDSYEWAGLYEAEALKPVINQGWAYDSKSRCWRSEQA